MEIKFVNRSDNTIETERPPGGEILKFLYNNPFGEKIMLPIAKQKFISNWYGKNEWLWFCKRDRAICNVFEHWYDRGVKTD